MVEAAEAAVDAGTPWVLDPVAVGMLPVGTALAHELAANGPTVIRANPSEILALAGHGPGGRSRSRSIHHSTRCGPSSDARKWP